MLKNLYARAVLWLIRPALQLRHEQQRFDSAAFEAEIGRLDVQISPSLFSALARYEQPRPCA